MSLTQIRIFAGGQKVFAGLRSDGETIGQNVVLRCVRVLAVGVRHCRVVAHQSAISGVASEALAGCEMLVRRAAVGDVRTFAVDRIGEQLDRPNVVARQQHPTRLLDAFLDQRQWN